MKGGELIEVLEQRLDESKVRDKVCESINRMLNCMLHQNEKCCKKCCDVSVCSILMEAVFVCRHRERTKSYVF
jgi:hypothetical protein